MVDMVITEADNAKNILLHVEETGVNKRRRALVVHQVRSVEKKPVALVLCVVCGTVVSPIRLL